MSQHPVSNTERERERGREGLTKWIFSLPTLYMRHEAVLLKSRLPLQFVQWKFSIQCRKTIKLTVLNSREDITETGPEITHADTALTCALLAQIGSGSISNRADTEQPHLEYSSFLFGIYCFPADNQNNVSFFEYLRTDDNFPLFRTSTHTNHGR